TTMVSMIADEVVPYDFPLRKLGEWLGDVVSPSWRGMRDELANLNFHNFNAGTDYLWFISACLNTILRMLQEGLTNLGDFQAECGYPIKKSSWDVVQKEFPELSLNLTIRPRK